MGSTKQALECPKLEKAVRTTNERIIALFRLSGRSIGYNRKAKQYKTRFKVMPPPDS
ncbi:MAG: hypothetical protein KGL59_09365 [Acidobacteriota bacterium]|nr:hypothetical protein [Acidobacteriota bacterium]